MPIRGLTEVAPEVAGGYEDIRAAIAADGALSAAHKALLVAAAAVARGFEELAAAELERGRALGLGGEAIGAVAAALLLARGEVVCGRFVQAAGALERSPQPTSEQGAREYFLEFFGVDELPRRIAIMARWAPGVFAGYHRMHHGVLRAGGSETAQLNELALVAVNAAELQTRFVAIHAHSARAAGVTDAQLVEAVVCAIPVSGVGAWAAAAEGLFPD
jgi:alkylhydroperoxidase/carboxymuconolactone decarboxylase family protein YurZ